MKIEIQLDELRNAIIVTAEGKVIVISLDPESHANIKSKKNGDFDFARKIMNEIEDALNKAQEER